VNDCQLTELLAERDALHLSRPTVHPLSCGRQPLSLARGPGTSPRPPHRP
jgi:hypothetical protein